MIIHVAGSIRKFNEDTQYMQTIVESTRSHGDQIAFDWVSAVKDRKERQSRSEESFDWQDIVENNIKALLSADALVVECSRFNWSLGYQTAIALQHKKPVLSLYRKDLPEYTEWPDKLFLSGISNPLFYSVPYKDQLDLQQSVHKFLDDIRPKTVDLDIHMSIDQAIAQQLDKLAHQTGRSQASIIKEVLQNHTSQSQADLL